MRNDQFFQLTDQTWFKSYILALFNESNKENRTKKALRNEDLMLGDLKKTVLNEVKDRWYLNAQNCAERAIWDSITCKVLPLDHINEMNI